MVLIFRRQEIVISRLNKYSSRTVDFYLFDIDCLLANTGKEKAEVATHLDIMQYVEYLRGEYPNAGTIQVTTLPMRGEQMFLI
jgi:hypothetical protein